MSDLRSFLVSPATQADGSKLPKDRSFVRSGNLTIKSIRKEDHGKYECVMENIIATLVTATALLVDSNRLSFCLPLS